MPPAQSREMPVLKTRDLDAFFRKKFLTKNILKYIPKTVTQVMAFFKSCTVAFQTRLRQAAEILQRVPVRHRLGRQFHKIKVRFMPPTMCRLTV